MKFTLNRSQLKQCVTGLSRIIPNRVTLPILGHVRFDLAQGLTACGTDLDQHAAYRFGECPVEGQGLLLLPLASLKELTKGRADEMVEFEQQGQQVLVVNNLGGHQVRTSITCGDLDEWPTGTPEVETKPAEGFLGTYRRLLPFASKDETRYVLNGICLDVQGKSERPITMVACDGRRLMACNSMALPIEKDTIVPAHRFLAWSGLEGSEAIGVHQAKDVSWFGLQVGAWTYRTRVIDGQFPNWRQVVPAMVGQNRIILTEEDVQALLKILPGFPGHESSDQAIGLYPGKNRLVVITGRGQDDRKDTRLELTGGSRFEGEEPTGVNRRYLMDALEAGFREFTWVDNLGPLKAEDGRGSVHVLMPLRLGAVPAPAKPESKTEQHPVETGKETTMANEKTEPEPTALDRLLASYEQAKTKLREAQTALADVSGAIKEAVRENRQLKQDVESVRSGLAKLQQIKV